MHGMNKIIQESESPLRTLNPISAEIDAEWIKVAKRRLAELRSGHASAISQNEVFSKIRERFEK